MLVLSWLALAGCRSPLAEEQVDGARHLYGEVEAKSDGIARVVIPVEAGESSFLATVQPRDARRWAYVHRLLDPDGLELVAARELTLSDFYKTNAVYPGPAPTLNWPVSDADAPLVAGDYVLEVAVVDDDDRRVDEPVRLDVLLARDADLGVGQLDVMLIYTDGLEADEELVAAVEAASAQWAGIYGEAGIDVRFETVVSGEAGLLAPGEDERYVGLTADTPLRSVRVVLSEVIELYGGGVLGLAGDIPGPLVPASTSAVQLSLGYLAGPDGIFDAQEIRIMAETLAHEAGHQLGLYHPAQGPRRGPWDALDDTPQCRGFAACEGDLGSNLMYPYTICDTDDCVVQNQLTEDQASVLHRAVATR